MLNGRSGYHSRRIRKQKREQETARAGLYNQSRHAGEIEEVEYHEGERRTGIQNTGYRQRKPDTGRSPLPKQNTQNRERCLLCADSAEKRRNNPPIPATERAEQRREKPAEHRKHTLVNRNHTRLPEAEMRQSPDPHRGQKNQSPSAGEKMSQLLANRADEIGGGRKPQKR